MKPEINKHIVDRENLRGYRTELAKRRGFNTYGKYLEKTYDNATDKWNDIVKTRRDFSRGVPHKMTPEEELEMVRKIIQE